MSIGPIRYLRARDIHRPLGILSISRSLFYDLLSKGDFPKGRRIAPNVVVWLQDDVIAWVRERTEQFSGISRTGVLGLEERQQMGTDANRSLAKQRWTKLAAEFERSGLALRNFAEQRCETGERPFTYVTRSGGTKTYPFETIEREVRRVLKEQQKART